MIRSCRSSRPAVHDPPLPRFCPASVCRLPTEEPILALERFEERIALVIGGEVLVSQHIGDLGDFQAEAPFKKRSAICWRCTNSAADATTVARFASAVHVHTDRRGAAARGIVAVQHHQAHIASVLAEHGLLDEPAIGVAFDGTGYGTDGFNLGRRILRRQRAAGFERCASLRPVAMPGGDAAARFPVQAAAGFLAELPAIARYGRPAVAFSATVSGPRRWSPKSPLLSSTSVGRLFDAVAALWASRAKRPSKAKPPSGSNILPRGKAGRRRRHTRLQPIHFPISIIARCCTARSWPIGRRAATWRTSALPFIPRCWPAAWSNRYARWRANVRSGP